MKTILENWKKYLNEAMDSRIDKMVQGFLAIPDAGIGITVSKSKDFITFDYIKLNKKEKKGYSSLTDSGEYFEKGNSDLSSSPEIPEGGIRLINPKMNEEGDCSNAWEVSFVGAKKGWGPLLYEIALEFASNTGGGLTSDRTSVSKHTEAVWEKYLKRSDVDSEQLDIKYSGNKKTFPQLTPNIPEDDCTQVKAVRDLGGNWHKSPLSKVYIKDEPEVFMTLKNANRLIFK